MSVDFQNGFLCGMATKGLTRSGQLYQPRCWNDEGIYEYFYIDFRQSMAPFSLGMWNESIVVHDREQLGVPQVGYIAPGIYKVWCDLSGRMHGITVLNKITSLLHFGSGRVLPAFSTHFFVAGIDAYKNLDYVYDTVRFPACCDVLEENYNLDLAAGSLDLNEIYETASFPAITLTKTENHSLVLT